MRRLQFVSLLALGLAMPALAAPQLRDFQLPPESSPTPSPQVEGPVDREGAVIIAPRAIPTATPTPSPTRPPFAVPTVSADDATTSSGTPTRDIAAAQGQPSPRPQSANPVGRIPQTSDAIPAPNVTQGADFGSPTDPQIARDLSTPPPQGTADTPTDEAASSGPIGVPWLWWALGVAGVAALGLAGRLMRKRSPRSDAEPPAIERPAVKTPQPVPPRSTAGGHAPALRVEAQVVSLSRSFANATLSYAITVSNRSGRALNNVRIAADMTTAHGSLPVDQQLANPATELPDFARFDLLGAAETREARGEFRLPVNQIRLIRQGQAALYVPLLRLRIHAEGIEPVLQTFVVGQKQVGPSSRLTPFRLDEMAQIYREIALRPLG